MSLFLLKNKKLERMIKIINKLDNKKYWVWFSQVKNLGRKRKIELLKNYKNPEEIYNLKMQELQKIPYINDKMIGSILNEDTRKIIQKNLEYMEENNVDIISIDDEAYPKRLKEIYDFPISLYIKGDIKILNNKSISIIGCRDASDYGKKAAKYFSYNLAKENINIVSGLARGIDSYAHIGCLCANNSFGKTIAVLGNGIDMIYPKENKYLAEEIIKSGGAIISEYPIGTKPLKMNFPARNRIVSGLSNAVLVIEAKERSGTLITVDFALEQGRDVYVVPGNINEINSVGTNNLIKEGAKIVTNYKEIRLQ